MKNISVAIDDNGVTKNFERNNYNPSYRNNESTNGNMISNQSSNLNNNIEEIDLSAPLKMAEQVREEYNLTTAKETVEQTETDKANNWITYVETTLKQLKSEKDDYVTKYFDKFNQEAELEILINEYTGNYYTPEEYNQNLLKFQNEWLIKHGYPTDDEHALYLATHLDEDTKYFEGINAFHEQAAAEYTEMYNKHFKEITGITYDEYVKTINTYNSDISHLKSQLYSLKQQVKEAPYLDIMKTEEYKNYCKNNKIDTSRLSIDGQAAAYGNLVLCVDGKRKQSNYSGYNTDPVNPILLAAALEDGTISYKEHAVIGDRYNLELKSILDSIRYEYLTEDDKMMYNYLFETRGKDEADKYIEAIEDRLNQAEGQKEMEEFMTLITDENGEINYNVWSGLLANGKGVLSGIENFGEGLSNVFATEGMISSNQYAQMYILNELTNTSGIYINSLAETIMNEQGEEEATKFIRNMINTETGEINLDYAKKNLSSEEYQKLEYKIKKDKETLLDDSFQLGASFGNMLPTMALTIALSYCGAAPAAVELVGNVLMGLSAGGNAKNQALVSGNDLLSSTIYGILSGTSETCLGMLIGNIPGLNSSATLSLKGIFKEGTEEFLQEYFDAGLRCAILGETIDISELNGDAIKSFAYGCLMSFGTNAASMGVKFIINKKSVELNNINDLVTFFKFLNNSETITSSNIKEFKNKAEVAEYFGDAKQYAYLKLQDMFVNDPQGVNTELVEYFTEIKEDGRKVMKGYRVNEIDEVKIFNMAQKYLSSEDNVKITTMKKEGINIERLKSLPLVEELIATYTEAAGPAIGAYLRESDVKFSSYIYDGTDVEGLTKAILDFNMRKNRLDLARLQIDDYVSILDYVIDSSPRMQNDLVVYRGVYDAYKDGTKIDPSLLKPGDILSDSAFLSTTMLSSTSITNDNRNIIMKINIPEGSKALYLESLAGVGNYGQQELLLPRNSELRLLKDCYTENGKVVLELELVQKSNDSTQIEMPSILKAAINAANSSEITAELTANITDKLPFITNDIPSKNQASQIAEFDNKPNLRELNLDKIDTDGKYVDYYKQSKAAFGNKYDINKDSQIDMIQVIKDLNDLGYLEILEQNIQEMKVSEAYSSQLTRQEHGIDHAERVLLFAAYIGMKEKLSAGEMSLLIESSKWHDCGRVDVRTDTNHAQVSAEKVTNFLSENYSSSDQNMIQAAIELHELDEVKYFDDICNKYKIPEYKRDSLSKITNILKDADALDRTRFFGNLDPNFLRTNTSQNLIKAAFQLQEVRNAS